tara:strand:- start:210 stop:3437 length:3228 start_codon:yes stop_codon:yes gene_type:complete
MKKNYNSKYVLKRGILTTCLFALTIFGVLANDTGKKGSISSLNNEDNLINNELLIPPKNETLKFGVLTFTSSVPANSALGISRSANIVLNFNEAVLTGTVNATNIKVSGSQTGNIAASFSGGGTTQITINPTTDFKAGELITVTLLAGLQSLATNEALSSARTFQFTVSAAAIDYFSLPITPTKTTIATGTTDARGIKSTFPVDLDGDGDMDIVGVSDPGDKLLWYENNGSQSFTVRTIASGTSVNALHGLFVIDLDDDGDMDIIATSRTYGTATKNLTYYLNNGSQVFTTGQYQNEITTAISRNVVAGDFDSDGDKDILIAQSYTSGYIFLLRNNGSLVFSVSELIDSSINTAWGISAADMDKDGDLDIVVGSSNSGTNTDFIAWYENNGTGIFTKNSITTTTDSVRSLFAIDIDSDGDMDFASVSYDNNTVSWYQNNGSQVFTKIDIDTGANGAHDVTAADVDGDGDIDVLSANQTDNTIALYLNNGSEVFTKKIITNTLSGARTVRFADMDGDGDLDIVTTAQSDELSWFENKLTNSWSGATNTNWDTTTNWSLGSIPLGTTDVLITNTANKPAASSNISVKSLVLNSGAALTVTGNVTTVNPIILESGSSLITKNSTVFNLTYKRNLATTNWYLISSPVVGQSVPNFVTTNNTLALGSGAGVAQNVALALYDNTQVVATNQWSYYTVGLTDGLNGDDTTDTFVSAKGFATKLTTAVDVSFSGTMPLTDVGTPISVGAGNAFNLVGNPYPSYIAATNSADATNNVLKANDTDNDFLSESTIWLWDQSANTGTGGYVPVNHATSRFIAPGQGFFVSANGSRTFSITEAMQSHQVTDVFSKSLSSRPEIQLQISNGTAVSTTDIYYINGTTLGFDNGYDSTIFSGVSNDFKLYTHLLANSQGQNLGIQSLPDSNFKEMVIPVGVNAVSGTTITFTAKSLNIPEGLYVYLEDKSTNTVTQLDVTDAKYTTTLTSSLTGIGRFYLHTDTQQVLSVDDLGITNISLYKTSESNLRIVGLNKGETSLRMYNLLGQTVLEKTFVGQSVNNVSLPNLRKGLYIIQLKTEQGKINKKIILE